MLSLIKDVAVIVACYNRPNELRRCLASIEKAAARFPRAAFVLVDDASTDKETIKIIKEFILPDGVVMKFFNKQNQGICKVLLSAYQYCFDNGFDIVTNLDSDAIIKPDFFEKMIDLHLKFPNSIVTGFHSTNRNLDGSERHQILLMKPGYALKKSVGGINFMMNQKVFNDYLLPTLIRCIRKPGNFDHLVSIALFNHSNPMICAVPSLVQHIANTSTLGHNVEQPDVADSWKDIDLPDVTLIGVDCVNINKLIEVADISQRNIEFGDVVLLSSMESSDSRVVTIDKLSSKAEYSHFMIKHLAKHIKTKYALIIQHDGYVVNPSAWSDEFLKYDYIGATWVYKDNMNVGNGGFSLRSKRLLDILANDVTITDTHPEDHYICRVYRPYLERTNGVRFAPEEVANKFSIEAYGSSVLKGGNHYSKQFGFHGSGVDFTGYDIPRPSVAKNVTPAIKSRFIKRRMA